NSLNLFFEYTNLALEEIEASDIRTFIAYRAQNGVGVSTLKKNISAIRTFFHYLTKEKLINFNPAEDIKIKKSSKVLPKFHEVTVINEVLDSNKNLEFERPSSTVIFKRDLALIEIAYSCGLRLEEIHSLQIENVEVKRKQVRVTGKGNKTRIIPLGSKAIEAYLEWLPLREEIMNKDTNQKHNYVFVTTTGAQLSRVQINKRIKNAFKLAGYPIQSNPHMLRHSFATHLINNSVGIREIQEMLGHSNLNTTQIYTDLDHTSMTNVYMDTHPRAVKNTEGEN
ncbi:TPA: tyrosine-type recombinase/integrase, partial [Acinetobacter baumannii]|nr:tyrosine-type recombinase/integrase [Acinetobacter baumannii]